MFLLLLLLPYTYIWRKSPKLVFLSQFWIYSQRRENERIVWVKFSPHNFLIYSLSLKLLKIGSGSFYGSSSISIEFPCFPEGNTSYVWVFVSLSVCWPSFCSLNIIWIFFLLIFSNSSPFQWCIYLLHFRHIIIMKY